MTPLVIEAAICPYRPGPPVFDLSEMIAEAEACLAAGAGIVHHHHDMRFDAADATDEMVSFGTAVKAVRPDAILYPDFLLGDGIDAYIGHVRAMRRAGAIDILPVDPGAGYSGQLDERGWPVGTNRTRFTFDDANTALRVARELDLPVTVGVFEPFHLRWALAHVAAGGLPRGSMVKLYFGGGFSLINIGRRALNFGLPPLPSSLDAYLPMLEGSGLPWFVGVIGDSILDLPIARYVIERGGHIRVGIEDAAGQTNLSNAETVEAVVALAKAVGRPIASGGDIATVLGMK